MNRDKEDALSMVWENRLDFSEPGDARLGPDAEVYTAAFNSTLKHNTINKNTVNGHIWCSVQSCT